MNKLIFHISDNCSLDLSGRCVHYYEKTIDLTDKQYKFLRALINNEGIILTFDQIIDYVWGSEYIPDNDKQGIRDLVSSIRSIFPEIGKCISNARGMGYKINLPTQKDVFDNIPMATSTVFHLSEQYKHTIPVSNQYYCEKKYLNKAIDDAFMSSNCLFLVGISGSGKSEASRYYGKMQMSSGKLRYVIPISLQENGKGDYEYLKHQILLTDESDTKNSIDPFNLISNNDLIIIDNYNDSTNPVIFDLLPRIARTKVIITAQDYIEEMHEYGNVLFIDSIDNTNPTELLNFSCEMFCRYSNQNIVSLSSENQKNCQKIVSSVGFHALTIKLMALHYKRSGLSLHEYCKEIEKSIPDTLKIEIKVSINKDGNRISDTPYEIIKHLFQAKLILRQYTDIERQVLGTIILMEPYTSELNLICELTGDYQFHSGKRFVKARNALFQLQEEGLIHIEKNTIYIHPLIKAMLCDSELIPDSAETIAEISYAYLVHM